MNSFTATRPSHQEGLPRFGRIADGVRRSGLSRATLYNLAAEHPGLFKKCGAATLVHLEKLDQILAELPPAEISKREVA